MNEHARDLIQRAQEQLSAAPEAALSLLDEAVEAAPDAPEVYEARGDHHLVREELGLAADELGYAVELDPERASAWRKLGTCEGRRGRRQAAAEAFAEAAEFDPEDAGAWQRSGEAWLEIGEHGRAIGAFEAGLEEDDRRPGLYEGRARASLGLDLLEDAAEDVRQLIRLTPGPEPYLLQAQLDLLRGRPEAAASTLAQVLDGHPDHVEALRLRGDALWEVGEVGEAMAAYERSLALAPGDADTRLAVAECRLALDDEAGAARAAAEVVGESEAEDGLAVELLARAQLAAGDATAAQQTLARGLEAGSHPDAGGGLAPLYYRRGTIYLGAGRANLAWRDARWAIDADPEYAEAYVLRGLLALDLEGVEEAKADLDMAIEIDPRLGTAWAWRGRARMLGGDLEGADSDWAEAEASLDDGDPLRSEVAAWRRAAG